MGEIECLGRAAESQGKHVMTRRTTQVDAPPETEVRITWHQWEDGRWEAWVSDNTGRSPHLVRDREELECFLLRAFWREPEDRPLEPHLQED
jgi:hypothetical protein